MLVRELIFLRQKPDGRSGRDDNHAGDLLGGLSDRTFRMRVSQFSLNGAQIASFSNIPGNLRCMVEANRSVSSRNTRSGSRPKKGGVYCCMSGSNWHPCGRLSKNNLINGLFSIPKSLLIRSFNGRISVAVLTSSSKCDSALHCARTSIVLAVQGAWSR